MVSFPSNLFKGQIIPALCDLLDKGLVRVIDLAVVSKDRDGNVFTFEVNELSADLRQR